MDPTNRPWVSEDVVTNAASSDPRRLLWADSFIQHTRIVGAHFWALKNLGGNAIAIRVCCT